jgi:hypothetical protein
MCEYFTDFADHSHLGYDPQKADSLKLIVKIHVGQNHAYG